MGAIQDLLITDTLFRNKKAETRVKWTKLVESVEHGGGKAFIFSSWRTRSSLARARSSMSSSS